MLMLAVLGLILIALGIIGLIGWIATGLPVAIILMVVGLVCLIFGRSSFGVGRIP